MHYLYYTINKEKSQEKTANGQEKREAEASLFLYVRSYFAPAAFEVPKFALMTAQRLVLTVIIEFQAEA